MGSQDQHWCSCTSQQLCAGAACTWRDKTASSVLGRFTLGKRKPPAKRWGRCRASLCVTLGTSLSATSFLLSLELGSCSVWLSSRYTLRITQGCPRPPQYKLPRHAPQHMGNVIDARSTSCRAHSRQSWTEHTGHISQTGHESIRM